MELRKAWIDERVAVRLDSLSKPELDRIRSDMTVAKKRFRKRAAKVELHHEEKGWLWLPRHYGVQTLRGYGFKFKDQRTEPGFRHHRKVEVEWGLLDEPPYPPDQSTLVKTVVEKTRANGLGGFFVAPTGSGKTLMGSYAAALLGGPALVVVHKTDLMGNWVKSLTGHVKVAGRKPRIGRIQASTCDIDGKHFVMATAQSLARKEYGPAVWGGFRTVLFDEAHHLPATTFLEVAYRLRAKYMLGTTATLRRSDGLDEVFVRTLGNTLYAMSRTRKGGRVFYVPVPFIIPASRIRAAGAVSLAKIGTTFATLQYRNETLLGHILKGYKEGRKNLVLCGTRDHLAILFNSLPPIVQRRAGFYVGGMKPEELRRSAEKQIMFGTFGMAKEGMDVPQLDMLTVGTPVKDIEQAVGRILRKDDWKMDPIVVDLADRHRTLLKWARERARYYRLEGLKIVTPIPA